MKTYSVFTSAAALCPTLLTATVINLGASAPACAQIEEIVVTARRREERLQDVPISITVFDQEKIGNHNITTGADLAVFTPSLTASQRYGSDTVSFAIRGFTQEQRTAASVAVYFAEVVAPRGGGLNTTGGDGTGPGAYFDLENVQVLKGPQGTLFGRNTTGGAVLVVPKKPEEEWGGYAEVQVGNYDMRRAQAVLNVPVNDSVRMRFGFDSHDRDGYARNISGVGPSRFYDADHTSARISLVVDITPTLENYTIASFTETDTNGAMSQIFACDPDNPSTGGVYGAPACNQMARNASGDFFTVENALPDAGFESRVWQVINTTTWNATDHLTVKNIASIGRYRDRIRTALFGENFLTSPLPPGLGSQSYMFAATHTPNSFYSNNQESWTEEFQLQGQTRDNRLIWQAGGYFEASDPIAPSGNRAWTNLNCADIGNLQCQNMLGAGALLGGAPLAQATGVGSVNHAVGTIKFRNWGLYAQGSYDISERLKMTAGLRYTSDKTYGTAQKYALYYDPTLPAAFGSGDPVSALCTAGDIEAAPNPDRLAALDACRTSMRQSTSAPTWVLGLDYKPADDVLLYAKYSRGYRQGSVNPFGPIGFDTFEEEEVDAYEIGAKLAFDGAVPGTLNIAGFYNELSNQQLGMAVVGGPGGALPGIVNAGDSKIWGVELEASVEPLDRLRLGLSYAYLNTELVKGALPSLPPDSLYALITNVFDIGKPLPLTPENKLALSINYELAAPPSLGVVSVGGSYTYTSAFSTSSLSSSGRFYRVDETELVSMYLNFNAIAGGPLDVSLFATNLFNEKYSPYHQGGINSLSFQSRILGQPRMYGMGLRYNF